MPFGPPGPNQHKVASANWPIGYSFLIHITSRTTGLSSLWASKLVNVIFLTLIFLLLYLWYNDNAWFVALTFVSYSSFEIFSHTWSEGPFLFFVILLAYLIYKQYDLPDSSRNWVYLCSCLLALFLLRYAGLVFLLLIGGLAIYCFWKKDLKGVKQYLMALSVATILIGTYLIYNYNVSGAIFGAHNVRMSALGQVDFFMTYLNAIGFARIYVESKDIVYYGITAFQFVLIVLFFVLLYHEGRRSLSHKSRLLLNMAFFYLLTISTLKLLIHAIDFDYRMMAPFSILLFLGVLTVIQKNESTSRINWVLKSGFIVFAVFSIIINLPNRYILSVLQNLIY
ncbi:hypothetical protein FNH22_15425 [Fulvivirga sp. M361]|uniref:hypothetical protein n=1 Tax=Fulvivirga sp. M361 TaxID=2594266 RepID=UPI00117B0BA7|nr:hypothetical protein [Fulvivirga sp. M361]TRX57796.1 hypothetical protein FNH22_15425 [Fulvivirga sp. M361]